MESCGRAVVASRVISPPTKGGGGTPDHPKHPLKIFFRRAARFFSDLFFKVSSAVFVDYGVVLLPAISSFERNMSGFQELQNATVNTPRNMSRFGLKMAQKW